MSNVFRSTYRTLSEEEKAKIARIKDLAQQLHDEFTSAVGRDGAREMALARTNVEQSVMWAVKAITG